MITAAVGLLLVSLTPLENFSYDLYFQFKPKQPATNVVLVYANAQTMRQLGADPLYLHRTNHVHLLDRLTTGGAKLVFYDLAFIGHDSDTNADRSVIRAISSHGTVILAAGGQSTETVIGPVDELLRPVSPMLEAAKGWGHAELLDTVVRRISGRYQNQNYAVWVAASLLGFTNQEPNAQRWLNYYTGHQGPFSDRYSFEEAITNLFEKNFLADKIVFVGLTLPGVDTHATPFSRLGRANRMAGVEIHATALVNLLRDDWLRLIPKPWQWLAAVLWSIPCVTLFYTLSRKATSVLMLAAAAATLTLCVISFLIQWKFHWWWAWIGPAFGQTAVAVVLVRRYPRPDPYFAFISYRTKDRDAVFLIHRAMSDRGYRVFVDKNSIGVGAFPIQLFRSIADASFFILLLSPKSLDSSKNEEEWKKDWIRQELARALSLKKPVVPVFKDGFQFETEDLPDLQEINELRKYQAVKYSNDDFDGFINQLMKLLKEHPGPRTGEMVGADA